MAQSWKVPIIFDVIAFYNDRLLKQHISEEEKKTLDTFNTWVLVSSLPRDFNQPYTCTL